MKRMAFFLPAAAIVLLSGSCGSSAKNGPVSAPGSARLVSAPGADHLLSLAVDRAKQMGISNPSTIGFASSGSKVTLLFAAAGAQGTRNYRAGVDLESGKVAPVEPVAPPQVGGSTAAARSFVASVTASLGMGSRTRISIVPARKRAGVAHPLSIIFSRSRSNQESEWRHELAATFLGGNMKIPIVSAAVEGAQPDTKHRMVTWSWRRTHSSFRSTAQKLALARKLTAAAERDGAAVTSLILYRSLDPVLYLKIETPKPAAYLKHDLEKVIQISERGKPALAGSYLQVVDQNGKSILQTGGITDMMGFVWVLPKLEGCSPIDHSRPPGVTIPPCPAK
jgi:hypothetical protein